MKIKKTPKTKTVAKRPSPTIKTPAREPHLASWSASVYVYWFIILFFIAATFYILGRSHSVMSKPEPLTLPITEEALLQANDYYESGKTKLLQGETENAISDLTIAIESDNSNADAYILRGEAYMQTGNYRSALSDFDNAIALDSNNPVAFFDRSLLNTRLEDYSSALNDINNALAAHASNPSDILQTRDLYAKRGQLNLWLKNWEGAIADYTNSLARPDGIVTPNVYAERAEAYTATGNYSDAITDYTSAVRIISEQIQGVTTNEEREDLSSKAMGYFEKSAALNLSLGNIESAKNDLQAAFTIATTINDTDTAERLQQLLNEI